MKIRLQIISPVCVKTSMCCDVSDSRYPDVESMPLHYRQRDAPGVRWVAAP